MCGIVGLRLVDEVVRREDIDAMNATIVHRGPDGDGVFVDENVGLGMRRLAIIDLEGGWQPIANETGRIQVVHNGEIYNHRELRKTLEASGHKFRTNSDTEVIVHAYEEWGGAGFANRLRGMFAIGIWDSDREELWLVRDRLGIKPLSYAQSTQGFAFASEVKSLLVSPIVPCELEPAALCEYLTYGSAGIDGSFVKNVRQLGPGCALRLSREHVVSICPYWVFRYPEHRLEMDEIQAKEALLDKLHETVRLHLLSDVPVGAFLSGGVDSSAIVGLMAEAGLPAFKTFSIGFKEDRFNELPYAGKVAKKWGCDHHEAIVLPDAVSIIDRLLEHLDEPFADASAIPTWYVSELAAEHVKVVLSGDGGDELFGGYDRYATAVSRKSLDFVPRLARQMGARISDWIPETFPGKYFLKYARLDAAGRYASEHCLFPLPLRQRLLLPEWQPVHLRCADPFDTMVATFRSCGAGDYVSDCMHFDTIRYLPMDILVKVDRMTMAHSLEARPPLLDHEFVEFASSLPTSLKFRSPNQRKHILREAAKTLVPQEVMNRPKSGFSVPLQDWFAGPLAPMFNDCVLTSGRCLDYLDRATILQLFMENRSRRRNHGLRLWAILILELWLRKNLHTQEHTPKALSFA